VPKGHITCWPHVFMLSISQHIQNGQSAVTLCVFNLVKLYALTWYSSVWRMNGDHICWSTSVSARPRYQTRLSNCQSLAFIDSWGLFGTGSRQESGTVGDYLHKWWVASSDKRSSDHTQAVNRIVELCPCWWWTTTTTFSW